MDMNVVFSVLFVIIALMGAYGLIRLKKSGKIIINYQELMDISVLFGLTMEMMNELGLTKEPMVKSVSDVVELTLEFIEGNYVGNGDETEEEIQTACEDFAFGLCEQFKLEMTVDRQVMIEKLIDIGLHQIGVVGIEEV